MNIQNGLADRMRTLLLPFVSLISLVMGGCSTDPYIHDFAYEGDTARVAAMIDDGWPPDRANDFGKTGLMIAAEKNDVAMAKVFIDKGANVNARTTGGWTALYYAAVKKGGPEIIGLLLDAGANVDQATDSDNWTPLMAAARYRNDTEVLNRLLDGGANLEQRNKFGWSPLMLAVSADSADMAKTLIHRGASFSHRNRDGKDVFEIAQSKQKVTVDFLEQERQRYQTELAKRLKREAEEQFTKRLTEAKQRDLALPANIRRDKYLVAMSTALKQEKFTDALLYAQLLEDNGTAVEDSLYFFWGEALLKEGQPERAIEKLNVYLRKAGSSGKYYTQALQLLLEAEKKI